MTPIQLDFKPSRRLITILVGFAILMSVMVILVDLVWYWQLIMIAAIVMCAAHAIGQHGKRCLPWAVVRLTVNAKHELHVTHKNGQRLSAQVKGSTVVTPYLTVIHISPLQDAGHEKAWRLGHAVIVVPDVDKEAYRQLRVWLRWGNLTATGQPDLP